MVLDAVSPVSGRIFGRHATLALTSFQKAFGYVRSSRLDRYSESAFRLDGYALLFVYGCLDIVRVAL